MEYLLHYISFNTIDALTFDDAELTVEQHLARCGAWCYNLAMNASRIVRVVVNVIFSLLPLIILPSIDSRESHVAIAIRNDTLCCPIRIFLTKYLHNNKEKHTFVSKMIL